MHIAHLTCKDCRAELRRYILVTCARAFAAVKCLSLRGRRVRVYPARRGAREGKEEVFVGSAGRDRERRVSVQRARRAHRESSP